MRRTPWLIAAISVVTAVPLAALPASADTESPSIPAGTVVLIAPADPSGQPPTLSNVAPYEVTSASGLPLGTRDRAMVTARHRTAEQKLAGTGLTDVAGLAHAQAAPAPAAAPTKGSPSRKDNGPDPVAEDADFDALATTLSAEELAVPTAEPTQSVIQDYEQVGINDCLETPSAYGPRAKAMSHLFMCSGQKLIATMYACASPDRVTCPPISWVTFTVTTIGRAQTPEMGPRTVSLTSLMRDFVPGGPQPELILAASLRLSTDCSTTPMLGSACLSDNPNGMSLPVSEWMLGGPGVGTYLTGPSEDGYGDDRLSYYDYATRITLQEESSATFGGGDFRCDYGRNLNVTTGCVFTSLAERFTRMSLSNPEHTLAAQHILVALYQPNATMPPGDNKVIPGLEESGLWLKRTVDGNTIKKNRSRARGACLKYDEAYKNDRRELDLQCDEFPFATTWQGAASGGDFSVRSMPAAQNGNGGTTLNAWYNTFRILHNDLFYVSVRP